MRDKKRKLHISVFVCGAWIIAAQLAKVTLSSVKTGHGPNMAFSSHLVQKPGSYFLWWAALAAAQWLSAPHAVESNWVRIMALCARFAKHWDRNVAFCRLFICSWALGWGQTVQKVCNCGEICASWSNWNKRASVEKHETCWNFLLYGLDPRIKHDTSVCNRCVMTSYLCKGWKNLCFCVYFDPCSNKQLEFLISPVWKSQCLHWT